MQARKLKGICKDPAELAHVLGEFGVFQGVCELDGALLALAPYMEYHLFEAGEAIVTEGKLDDCLYLLVHGEAHIYRTTDSGDRFMVAETDGSQKPFFGEGAMLHAHKRSATIVTTTASECLILKREAFDEYAELYPQWGLPIIKAIAVKLSKRLRKATSDYLTVYHAYVQEIRGD